MKASTNELDELHGTVAKKLKEAIDEMGSDTKGLASVLNVARQFLKDNNIEAAAVPGSPVGALAEKVARYPFDPAEDNQRSH